MCCLGFLTIVSCKTLSGPIPFQSPPAYSHEGFSEANPLVVIPPRFPRKAAMEQIEGYVVFEFNVDEKGYVENLVVRDSYPETIFLKEATRAIEKWRFKPDSSDSRYRYIMEFKMGKEIEQLETEAQQGITRSQEELALEYKLGRRVETDLNKSIFWFTKAADAGSVRAMIELGMLYGNQQNNVFDKNKAILYLSKAADNQSIVASYELGVAYFEGQFGEKDIIKARTFLKKATDAYYPKAISFWDKNKAELEE